LGFPGRHPVIILPSPEMGNAMANGANRSEIMNYISDMSSELAKMAAAAECDHVAFLLELARIEAAATADISEDQTAALPLAGMQ